MGHTKGPWAYDTDMVGYEMPNRQYYARIYAVNPGLEYDFTVGFARDADPAQRAANAALLAAAPDLLEALEAFVEGVRVAYIGIQEPEMVDHSALMHEWPNLVRSFHIARAAIAAAKGAQ